MSELERMTLTDLAQRENDAIRAENAKLRAALSAVYNRVHILSDPLSHDISKLIREALEI